MAKKEKIIDYEDLIPSTVSMDENESMESYMLKLECEVDRLEVENTKIKMLLEENDIEFDSSMVDASEAICLAQINRLKQYSDERALEKQEIQSFEILNKQLISIQSNKKSKTNNGKLKKLSTKQLMSKLKN